MRLTDTHSHIYDEAFDDDRPQVVERARAAVVERIFLPAIDPASHERMFSLCREYPGLFFPMMGLHPTSVNDNPDYIKDLEQVELMLNNPPVERFYAVGEVGLDLYWSRDWEKQQREAFERQIDLAHRYRLPLVIHTREAWAEMTETLLRHRTLGLRGVMHAFSGTYEDYKKVREAGDFAIGVGGPVTYKKSALAEFLHKIPLTDVVLETDAPYLPPVPYRGKRNESAYVALVCEKVAEIYGRTAEEVAEQTTANAERIFFNTRIKTCT